MSTIAVEVYKSRAMDAGGLVESCLTPADWGPSSTRIEQIHPLSDIVRLYSQLLSFLAFDSSEQGRNVRRFMLELISDDPTSHSESALLDLLTHPPLLVVAPVGDADGCHYRVTNVRDVIFLDSIVFGKWTSASSLRPMSIQHLSHNENIKAIIVHELAHRLVTQRVGALPSELFPINLRASGVSSQDQKDLLSYRKEILALQKTPPRFHLPWKSDKETEAGHWLEYHAFGGIMILDPAGRATMKRYGNGKVAVLSTDALNHAGANVIINYFHEYPELFEEPTVSPSPSTSRIPRQRVSIESSGQRPLCAGVRTLPPPDLPIPPESAEDLAALKRLLAHVRGQKDDQNPTSDTKDDLEVLDDPGQGSDKDAVDRESIKEIQSMFQHVSL
ncbi:hypothetical protein FB451DRAFT_323337 [Mycena latifolia]|nr:hypothetical protein FB451DRAFT_323337 [Mycena latifolia]